MEEKKFDIKSLIGFTLIFGILMWMMYSNQPTKEELAEKAKSSGPLQPLIDVVPDNFFLAMTDNASMLQVILFVILYTYILSPIS